mgnify:CR=1 FL=1
MPSCSGTTHLLLGDTFKRDDAPLEGAALQTVLDTVVANPELGIIEPDPVTQEILDFYAEDVDVMKAQILGVATEDL